MPAVDEKPPLPLPIPEPKEADYQRFAEKCLDVINRQDVEALSRLVDDDALLERGKVPSRTRDAIRGGVGSAISRYLLPNEMRGGFSQKFALLRMREEEKQHRAICRITQMDAANGFGYAELILAKNASGNVKLVDVFSYFYGRQLSDDLGDSVPDAAIRLQKLLVQGQFKEVGEEYRRLPRMDQSNLRVLKIRILAARQLSVDEFAAGVADMRRYHPNFSGLPLMEYVLHGARKEFDEALKCVARLDDMVGGDPYLDVVRAQVHIQDGRWDRARAAAEKARQREPTLEDAYWVFVHAAVHDRNHAETLRQLQLIHEKFGGEFDGLEEDDFYAEFIKTPQWQEWQKHLQKKRR